MTAIAARMNGANVLLIEKGDKLGRKLGISGGGRCNVTNAKPLPELMRNIPGNSRFLQSALSQYSNADIVAFFEELGIRLKEEDRGRVFPVSDRAATVVQALVGKVVDLGVDIWRETPVRELWVENERARGVRLASSSTVAARAIVVATGGCSVPQTGSTGDAYPWAKAVGHTLVAPYPTEVPLTSDEWFISERALQGLSLRDIEVTIVDERQKKLTTEEGDLIFTHFGLSGPAALRCSHYVSTGLRKNPAVRLTAFIDVAPTMTRDDALSQLQRDRAIHGRKQLASILALRFPERLARVMLACAGVEGATQMANAGNDALGKVARTIKAFPVHLTGTLPLAKATVTGGGVSVKEIDPKTMASKLCEGLFFAGEVMDVHAHTGGYNITVAFSTGRCAGANAARFALRAPTR